MSVRTYTDKQLAEMNAKELETHTWKGKEYNAYQATQYQRKMETTMRAQRSTVRELQRGDGDKDTIEQAKARYQGMLHQYNKFSRTMKLEPQMERVYLDGLGRVVNTGYHKKTNTGGEKTCYNKGTKRPRLMQPQIPLRRSQESREAQPETTMIRTESGTNRYRITITEMQNIIHTGRMENMRMIYCGTTTRL